MFNFELKKLILIFLLLFKILVAVKTASLTIKNDENERSFEVKKLTKRGHFDSKNDWGPPVYISSGVLHIEEKHQHHKKEPIVIYQGVLSQHLPIWNDIFTEWQPTAVHAVLQTGKEEHFLQPPTLGGSGEFTLGVPEIINNGGSGSGSGLHTHIIGSSTGHGHNILKLDDKIDINNNIDTKEKYYIKSYG